MRSIDYAAFDSTLLSSTLITEPATDVDEYVNDINHVVISELNKVAPLRLSSGSTRSKPCDSFLSVEARTAIRARRRLERILHRTGSETVRQTYRVACRHANKLILESRAHFLSNCVKSATNSSQRWREFNKLLHPNCTKSSSGLSDNPQNFCEKLANFFTEKITNLHLSNETFLGQLGIPRHPNQSDSPCLTPAIHDFTPVTPQEVLKLISATQIKPSSVDAFPSSLIKACPISFSIIISNLANLSFASGRFPSSFKFAIVTPILKKPNLNPEDPSNYRPISNLNSISKLIERLVLSRLSPIITTSSTFNQLQSAYRKFHSTETCLLKTLSDVYSTIDSGSSALIASLDLSAAFDTIHHNTLQTRLQTMYGLSGNIISWISSYLSDRSYSVSGSDKISCPTALTSGVPQGSVLGPLLFTSYISPISSIVSSYGLTQQQYADDTQIYLSLSKTDPRASINSLHTCLSALRIWFALNGLTLNPTKSEAIIVSTNQRVKKLNASGLTEILVDSSPVLLSPHITTLGLTIDNSLTFTKHVKTVSRACMFHIRALKHIRHLLSQQDANAIATCLINSKLDYLNSALYNTSKSNLLALQRLQNCAARVVLQAPNRSPPLKLLNTLHWLPIKYRIDYKIASLTHTLLTEQQPMYLSELIHNYTPSRELRSSEMNLLATPRTHLKLSDQSFTAAAPTVWNSLPNHLRTTKSHKSFCSALKTHLFSLVLAT